MTSGVQTGEVEDMPSHLSLKQLETLEDDVADGDERVERAVDAACSMQSELKVSAEQGKGE